MEKRQVKDVLYSQVARIGKAVCSPKRLELIEILCQGEKNVDTLATEAEISVKLASAHLKELRLARLVDTRREGKNIFYRLVDRSVADFWVSIRSLAEERLVELRLALTSLAETPDQLTPLTGRELLAQAKRGEVVVIDVRPQAEFDTGHLPYAQSMPLSEVERRIRELPKRKPVVAYCRGPFCLMAREAVSLLRAAGVRATLLNDGVAEWRARGLPVQSN